MLLRWDIEHPGQVKLMPAPIPTWDGVEYHDSAALPTFRTGDGVGPSFSLTPSVVSNPTKVLATEHRVTAVNVNSVIYSASAKMLTVSGTAPVGTTEISVFEGSPTGGVCSGPFLGKAAVNSNGTWVYKSKLATEPLEICGRNALGSDDSLRVNAKVGPSINRE